MDIKKKKIFSSRKIWAVRVESWRTKNKKDSSLVPLSCFSSAKGLLDLLPIQQCIRYDWATLSAEILLFYSFRRCIGLVAPDDLPSLLYTSDL